MEVRVIFDSIRVVVGMFVNRQAVLSIGGGKDYKRNTNAT